MRESALEEWTVDLAKKNGWLVRKLRWIGRTGAPDRLFARDGRAIFVEFKAPLKEPNIKQKREHGRMIAAGLDVMVIDNAEVAKIVFGDPSEIDIL